MGSIGETAMSAVDEMRSDGISVGVARIRVWRPFPFRAIFSALETAKIVAVVDRMLSPGGHGGPVGTELRAAFYNRANKPMILDFVAGLGGRDISRQTFRDVARRSLAYEIGPDSYDFLDVRAS
jgi:pyruvate ferredoxin oxidoreductase alpha subunit